MSEPWQERETRDDTQRMDALRQERSQAYKALFFTLAVVIAPFLALVVFNLEVALVVLSCGLVLTIVLTWNASAHTGPVLRSRLRTIAFLNVAVLIMVLAILVLAIRA